MTATFEAVVARIPAGPIPDPRTMPDPLASELSPFEVFQRVGALTRKLHDALQQLGYYSDVEAAVGSLPDARARLDYVAMLTGQAAERVLGAAESGMDMQAGLAADARALLAGWSPGTAPDAAQSEALRAFLERVPQKAEETSARLSDIMLAQDFHDLTGQTIQRIVTLARNLEDQLIKLLLETTPPERRASVEAPALEGPVVSAEGRADVVANQGQVDDLLESLGF